MSGKRFAHFLISGKLAVGTMVLPVSGPSGILVNDASATTLVREAGLHVVELSNDSAMKEHDTYPSGTYGVDHEPQVTHGATLNIPGPDCTFSASKSMDVVVTGINPGDNVYVVTGDTLDDPDMKEAVDPRFRIGASGLNILAYFTAGTSGAVEGSGVAANFKADMGSSFSSVKLRVDIANLEAYTGQEVYIQVVSLPASASSGDWSKARFSEVDTIKIEEMDCSGTYGTPGGPY